jgi:hypothetical protein
MLPGRAPAPASAASRAAVTHRDERLQLQEALLADAFTFMRLNSRCAHQLRPPPRLCRGRATGRFDSCLVHQICFRGFDRRQVVEGGATYAGSNKSFSVERDSLRKEQLLQAGTCVHVRRCSSGGRLRPCFGREHAAMTRRGPSRRHSREPSSLSASLSSSLSRPLTRSQPKQKLVRMRPALRALLETQR